MTDSPPRTRTIAGKTPKFRASCDSCNEAKVRCSQTRPSCARCLKHGVDCVYGISLRAGKHRADSFRNNAAALPATTATVTPNGNSPVERTASLTSTTAQSPLEDSNFPDLLQQQLEDWAYENFVIPGVPDTFQAPHFDGNHHSLLKGDETHMLSLLQTPSLTALHQLSEATLPSIRPGSTSSSSLHNAEFASLSDT
ncbi:MAG: hypothetical protein M1830_008150, partial [Pleopsidium flavum]